MSELLSKLDGQDFLVLVLMLICLGGGVLIALVLGLAGIFASHRRGVRESELKQEMVRKGLSAEDIERVIRAAPPGPYGPFVAVAPPAAQPLTELSAKQLEVRLATELAATGMDAEGVERAVGAAVGADLETKRAVVQAVATMIANGTDEEQMCAAVVALCKPAARGVTELVNG